MPITYEIDEEAHLLVVRVAGDPGPDEADQAMRAIQADPRFHDGMHVLSDRRAMTSAPSTAYVQRIIAYVASSPVSAWIRRWAVLVDTPAGYGMGRMGQLLAERKAPFEVAVFTDEAEARRWLGETGAHRHAAPSVAGRGTGGAG